MFSRITSWVAFCARDYFGLRGVAGLEKQSRVSQDYLRNPQISGAPKERKKRALVVDDEEDE